MSSFTEQCERIALADQLKLARANIANAINVLMKAEPSAQDMSDAEGDLEDARDQLKAVYLNWPEEIEEDDDDE
jgi:hypothetical protein